MGAKVRYGASLTLVSLFLYFAPVVASQTPWNNEQQQILLRIKREWGGEPALDSWNVDTTNTSSSFSYCDWPGVGCADDGSVVNITLSGQDAPMISRPIPASLCGLKNLTRLDVSYNSIPGPFPTSLYNCSSLRYLDLSQNRFVGAIPTDVDRLSPLITHLDLSSNNFSGDIPPSIGRITAVQELVLNSNLFYGSFPAEIGNLSRLQQLVLAYNSFAPMRIPSEFGNLTKLTFLWMTSANLQGEIPASFAQLKGLTQLDLSQNSLTGAISTGIWGLPNLQYLYLYRNNLSGSVVIDGPIGALGLLEIDLSMNQLTGSIPDDFGKLKSLSLLYLYYNSLSGEIPASIGKLPSLSTLRLFNNGLTGVLPPELGKNSPLLDIEVNDNMISGELPDGLCDRGAFNSIVVSNNNLTGRIPPSLGKCSPLTTLFMNGNQFSGEVPDGIWAAVNLTILIMNNNAFSGTLPHKFPPKLSWLEIVGNRFTGKIPSSAPSLVVFLASNNMFSGELPSDLAGLSTLQLFYLGNNMISGRIPEDISLLKSLAELNLRHNQLTGEIPTSIGSLKQLISMDLSGNELSGSIPSEMGNLKLSYVNLSSNHLSGEIPVALQAEAYDQSFLSNPGLCASNSLLSVPTCATRDHNLLSRLGLRILLLALGALVFLTAATLFSICVIGKYRKRRHLTAWTLTPFHSLDFTKSDIVNGIKEENLIGVGGAGKVYRVTLGNRASEIVAAKKIWNGGNLDGRLEKQFQAELQILGSIRHKNIIKLLCCCSSLNSKLLVYEYMENGSLHKWLHRKHMAAGGSPQETPLDWPRRLEIAIGSARGLCYMHHDCSPPIIHRDVKSSNILLDSELNVKIADFGLARTVAKPGEPDTASVVAGSHGYIAPECGYSRRLNEKVDVYSFGVVLLELTTGREAYDGGDDQCNLAEWSRRHLQEGGEPGDAIDPELRGSSHVDDMATVFELGVLCTETSPSQRPSMKEVSRFLMRCKRA
ncbi:receptor-like protein kinase HSL1 [Musa acuminata AAA Group]|uniref:receptor-like protein kinase HSL1 n=1 Tax=Musa acuminata AAA Group TaxID=214697 RepID=UPI0031D877D1